MYNWDEKYSVGIQSIDDQHKELFELLDSLLEAMIHGQGSTATAWIILKLDYFASVHFQKEEFFFQRFNYPDAEKHIMEHNYFLEKISSLKYELKSGNANLALKLFHLLKDWIERHILIVDKQYSECFLKNGLR